MGYLEAAIEESANEDESRNGMTPTEPYNPLDKRNLGASVADAILKQTPVPLPPSSFNGAGVYAIYYTGDFDPYKLVSFENQDNKFYWPIYVGKAVPEGGRKGVLEADAEKVGPVLCGRLKKHAESIKQSSNLLKGRPPNTFKNNSPHWL